METKNPYTTISLKETTKEKLYKYKELKDTWDELLISMLDTALKSEQQEQNKNL